MRLSSPYILIGWIGESCYSPTPGRKTEWRIRWGTTLDSPLQWGIMLSLYQGFSSMASRNLRYETCFDRWCAACIKCFSSLASRALRYETCFDRWCAAYEYIGRVPNANDAREEFFTYLNGTPRTRALYVMRVRQTKIAQTVNVSFKKDV